MIFVVRKSDRKILNRCDAWEYRGEERMLAWCEHNGYKPVSSEITLMGDMNIWVE